MQAASKTSNHYFQVFGEERLGAGLRPWPGSFASSIQDPFLTWPVGTVLAPSFTRGENQMNKEEWTKGATPPTPREILDKSGKSAKRRQPWQGGDAERSRRPGVWSRHTVTFVVSQGLKHGPARHKCCHNPARSRHKLSA